MNKIIALVVTFVFLSVPVASQGYDDLIRNMDKNTNELKKEINSYNAAFEDVFHVISTNTSRLIMATVGAVIITFFIFMFFYIRSKRHFTRTVTQVMLATNQELVERVAAENDRFVREVEGLVSHSQKLQQQQFVPLDSYIDESLERSGAEKEPKRDESDTSPLSNGQGSDAPELPEKELRRVERKTKKPKADSAKKKKPSRRELRKAADKRVDEAQRALTDKKASDSLASMDQTVEIAQKPPEGLKPAKRPVKRSGILGRFKKKGKKPVTQPKKEAPPKKAKPKAKVKKKGGLFSKFKRVMTSTPNELMSDRGDD